MRTNNIKEIIKEYFLINPSAKLRVRQIERELKLPLPSVIRYVKELEKEEILKSQKVANIQFFTSNRGQKFFIEKKLFNIKKIYSSGLIDYIKQELSNPAIAFFGSFSLGEDLESSDIDLYIETPSKKKLNLEKFEKSLKRKIQVFSYENLNKIPNKELRNNVINGVVLNGFIEVFNG